MNIDFRLIRKSFPYFNSEHAGIYLDSAATTHKPQCVIDAVVNFYEKFNANVHRGLYTPGNKATEALENTRKLVANFINASIKEIVFTSGATEGINFVSESYVKQFLEKNDEILVSLLEHNSNYLPWAKICAEKGAVLKTIPLDSKNSLDLNVLEKLLSRKSKVIAVTLVSNIHGGIMPIEEIVVLAKKYGAKVVVDAAQALSHIPIDVKKLNCDFLVASSHKAYGPTGTGFLYIKEEHSAEVLPYKFGGGMVENIQNELYTFAPTPYKFEAGTPNISGIIGFGAALEFIRKIGFTKIIAHEQRLLKKIYDILSTREGIVEIEAPSNRCCIISLQFLKANPLDIAIQLDAKNIYVRCGKLCCHKYFNDKSIPGVLRMSTGVYTTESEIEIACEQISSLV